MKISMVGEGTKRKKAHSPKAKDELNHTLPRLRMDKIKKLLDMFYPNKNVLKRLTLSCYCPLKTCKITYLRKRYGTY
jgi:hypothetical protein